MMAKYHDGAIVLIAAFLGWILLLGCTVWGSFVRADAARWIAAAEQAQQEAESAAAVLLDQLDRRALLT